VILVDTSVWIDHLHVAGERLTILLTASDVLTHPFIIGELAVGRLSQRDLVLTELQRLPRSKVASDPEVLRLIARHRLMGLGIGYIDAHLLAATLLTPATKLWSHDKRLMRAAETLAVAVAP
jgi:predicted nucleic acid-binding protein